MSLGRYKEQFLLSLLALAINAGGNWALIPLWGAAGVAVSTTVRFECLYDAFGILACSKSRERRREGGIALGFGEGISGLQRSCEQLTP